MLRILHLEDSPTDAFLLKRALTASGIEAEVALAQNQAQFSAALEGEPFDVILADGSLPGFTGFEALEEVKKRCPDTPFVCVSGTGEERQVKALLSAGASDFVTKDNDRHLIATIGRVIAAKRYQTELLRLVRHNKAMTRLVAAVQQLSLARDLNGIMSVVRTTARELTGADGATFVLRDGEFCYYAEEDAIAPLWKGQRFPLSACISGWAMLNRQPAIIPDIYADPRVPVQAYRPTFVKSLVMVPIRTEAPIGAIGNYWAVQRKPAPEEVELLQALANTTAVAMENVQVYAELEERVRKRTAELEAANRELDSFSYAVAHDLGAPLRTMRGFTGILFHDYGPKLDPAAKELMDTITGAGKQMSDLIADLLQLSKVSKAPIQKRNVRLDDLARQIIAHLRVDDPKREVDAQVGEGLEAQGDPGLLRNVLENLLSNAWKYTSKTAGARIEFGAVSGPDGTLVFHVKDNGAGFDMKHADSLFRPFHRLHTQTEFPGTGVGLATVQRIIQRHGGKIWAQSEEGKGASFYFTL
ncbi:MAG: histidine kinase [Verrucomicrobia bacterium]|nr:MAG: histidine kinase [Verrucomicrobiota bacterium]